ncbi:hypothetical protein KGY73_07955 [bacterium]|nr:hypothetical protein [bacterium]
MRHPDDERSGKYYTLKVRLAATADDYEPNESLKEAAEVSPGKIKGSINPSKDIDYYKFPTSKKGTAEITLNNPTLELQTQLVFFNQNRELIGTANAKQKGVAKVSGEFEVEADKDYFVAAFSSEYRGKYGIQNPGEESSNKSYTLEIKIVEK